MKPAIYQLAMFCYFIILFAKPEQIHVLLIVANSLMIVFDYMMTGALAMDVLFWSGIIIVINAYWLMQDMTEHDQYHHPSCRISHKFSVKALNPQISKT